MKQVSNASATGTSSGPMPVNITMISAARKESGEPGLSPAEVLQLAQRIELLSRDATQSDTLLSCRMDKIHELIEVMVERLEEVS